MSKILRKKLLAGALAGMMIVGIVPTKVFASENLVSKEKLENIVQEEVNNLNFDNLGIDKIIEQVNSTVTNKVTSTVKSILTVENIKTMLTPIIKGLVNEAIKDFDLPPQVDINKIIDDVLSSQVVDIILTNKLTQEIIERTIEYSVDDIMNIIKVPTTGEIIDVSKEELKLSVVQDIWNAEPIKVANGKYELNPYYSYNIKWIPFKVNITGWNREIIKSKIQVDLLSIVTENTKAPDLSSINYESIIKNAAKRAVNDIVNEKINEVKATINTVIQNKANELKEQTEQAIKNAINSIKDKFPLWPRKINSTLEY